VTRRRQLALDLGYRPDFAAEEFLLSACNRTAWAAVHGAARWPGGHLALTGPEGSGKTHLAAIWGRRAGALRMHAAELTEARLHRLMDASAAIVENVDRMAVLPQPIAQQIETLLLHLFNLAAADGVPLLLTGRQAPGHWRIETPDLGSRLAAMPHVAIMPPDDEILSRLLHKLFRDRHQTIGDDVVEYLVRRMERSFASAKAVVAALDRKALAERRRITRPLAAEYFAAEYFAAENVEVGNIEAERAGAETGKNVDGG
jgi:chromosomal replication initiation ATPase DnaA